MADREEFAIVGEGTLVNVQGGPVSSKVGSAGRR